MEIKHWGAINGVTGSCHQLVINSNNSILIDCGLFQGNDVVDNQPAINFDISTVKALIVTHCHIDHVGRIPQLLAAGFRGPIYATEATAKLLPLVIEDALKVGVTKDRTLIDAYVNLLKRKLVPIKYKQWFPLSLDEISANPTEKQSVIQSVIASTSQLTTESSNQSKSINSYNSAKVKFQPAGHILGSAYVEVDLGDTQDKAQKNNHRIVFSGDLGAPHAPLLPAPKSPYRADTLVIESTYGDKLHEGRRERRNVLKKVIERCLKNKGTVLIPAFSIGRTQELLYELEQIIHTSTHSKLASKKVDWQHLDIIVDSPLASKFTKYYQSLSKLWDAEAKKVIAEGRHPLSFEQLITIKEHAQHMDLVRYLKNSGRPAVVIAASGMCTGGRIQNYLEELLPDERTDVIFIGYQGVGTPGRDIQKYGPRGGYVHLGGRQIAIKAAVHTISGYSAHADQANLVNFVKRMHHKPKHIKIVHGDEEAKQALRKLLKPFAEDVEIARS
ncbi:MAG: metallo-beta-lactamase family protein [Enterobacterales bacterium]|jgi:metallo-beta-lactamase family protein